jgi:O-antigen/teichoic acid export membrane protein
VLAEQAVQDVVGHAAMGLYAALLALAYTLRPVADLGLAQLTTRRIAEAPAHYAQQAGPVLGLKLMLSGAYMLAVAGTGWALGYTGQALGLLLLLGLLHAALNLLEFWRAVFQGQQHFRVDGLAGVWDKTLLMLIVAGMLAAGAVTLSGFVWANVLTMASGVFLFGWVAWRSYGPLKLRFSRSQASQLLQQSLPYAAIMVLFSLNERIHQLLVERLASPQESGYFYAAFRWVATLQMYLWTVLPIFFARFAKLGQAASRAERQSVFGLAQQVAALPVIGVCGVLWFQGERLFFLFDHSLPHETEQMVACLRGLTVAFLLNGFFNVYSTYLTATGHTRWVNLLLVASTALGAGAGIATYARYGAVAAGWGTALAFGVLSLGYVAVFARRAQVGVPWALLARLALCAVGYFVAYWAFMQWQGLPWWLPAPFAGAALAGLALGLGVLPRPRRG